MSFEGLAVQVSPVIASTLRFHDWGERVHTLDRALPRSPLWKEVMTTWEILKAARKHSALLLNGSSGRIHPDLIACILLGLIGKRHRPPVVLGGDVWEPARGLRRLIQKVVVRLADRGIDRYVVWSADDRDLLAGLWGISTSKIGVCLCYHHVTDEELAGEEAPSGGHIFAGGDSGRDYPPLVEAARCFPQTRFVLATAWTSPTPLPPNVELVLPKRTRTSHAEFIRLMRSARAVIVPLRRGMRRTIGQQTLLNSMYMGKPTIVVGALGVRDYASDGENALVVDGTVDQYVMAIGRVLDPENQAAVNYMAEQGRVRARAFSPAATAETLYAEVSALLSERTET